MGSWFFTFSGTVCDVQNPRRSVVSLVDIAHSLSMQCRFNGHVRQFYSVAQHSVFVSRIVPSVWAAEALLHDASEAYLGDIIRPLKQQLDSYRRLEEIWEIVIGSVFSLCSDSDVVAAVKLADRIALATERKYLQGVHSSSLPWDDDELVIKPDDEHWTPPLLPDAAEKLFVDRCVEIGLVARGWL